MNFIGCAISIHGKYRIATENTTLAMPETKIGKYRNNYL